MISSHALTRRFGEKTAVDAVTLEIPKGAICAFMGPNGAGKSTTVNMLTGLLTPTSGDATVAGFSILIGGVELRRRIGVLPANLGLFEDLTVEEHLLLTGDVHGLSRPIQRAARPSCCARSIWSTGATFSPAAVRAGCARRPHLPWP